MAKIKPAFVERTALLHTDGIAGRETQPCVVTQETPTRYRIRALAGVRLRLPMGKTGVRVIYWPGTTLVLKAAVTGLAPDGRRMDT